MFEDYDRMRKAVLEYMDRICEQAREDGINQIADVLNITRNNLKTLRYTIAVMGHLKRGKSTLINALLGRSNDDISPIASKVCTSTIVEYMDMESIKKEEEGALVTFKNGQEVEIPIEDIKEYVTEKGNPQNARGVLKVSVWGEFPLLNESVILLDMPGSGTIYEYHDALLQTYLPLSDAIIFIIAADLPLENGEKELLKELNDKEKRKIFFVLNKVDTVEKKEMPGILSWINEQVAETGLRCDKLYKISAKQLYMARKQGASEKEIEEILVSSGIAELEKDLEKFIEQNSDKSKHIIKRIISALEQATKYCNGTLNLLDSDIAKFDTDIVTLEKEFQEKKEKSKELINNMNKSISNFEKEWNHNVVRFLNRINSKIPSITDRINTRLKDRNLINKAFQGFSLNKIVAQHVQEELSAIAIDLVGPLESAAKKLHEELGNYVDTYVSKKEIRDIMGKATSLGALILGGSGISIAGSSVMTTISSISSSWTAFSAASSAAAGAANQVGWIQGSLAKLVGIGGWGTGKATMAANLMTAKSTALNTAIHSSISGLVTIGLVAASLYIGKNILEISLDSINESKLNTIVSESITETGNALKKNLDVQKQMIIDDYKNIIGELIQSTEEQIEQIKESIEKQDPQLKIKLEGKRIQLTKLHQEGETLRHSLKALYPHAG